MRSSLLWRLPPSTSSHRLNFNWKTEHSNAASHAGFIAQEVSVVLPDLVKTEPDGYYALSYGGFAPYLAGAVQAVDKKGEALRATVAAQKAQLAALTAQLTALEHALKIKLH